MEDDFDLENWYQLSAQRECNAHNHPDWRNKGEIYLHSSTSGQTWTWEHRVTPDTEVIPKHHPGKMT